MITIALRNGLVSIDYNYATDAEIMEIIDTLTLVDAWRKLKQSLKGSLTKICNTKKNRCSIYEAAESYLPKCNCAHPGMLVVNYFIETRQVTPTEFFKEIA